MRNHQMLTVLITLCGCIDVDQSNQAPIASAGADQMFAYEGLPVTVTLDGSESFDPDGMIDDYLWFNTGICPNERYQLIDMSQNPLGGDLFDWDNVKEYEGDPSPQARPDLTLGEGDYRFTLWVRDDEGAVSVPSTVHVSVHRVDPASGEIVAGGIEIVGCAPCPSGTRENEVGVCM